MSVAIFSSSRDFSVGSTSFISFRYSLRITEAPRFAAFSSTVDNVVCSMVISYKAVGTKASNKRKSINKQAANSDCNGVSGSIIKCPVLGDNKERVFFGLNKVCATIGKANLINSIPTIRAFNLDHQRCRSTRPFSVAIDCEVVAKVPCEWGMFPFCDFCIF